MRKTENFNTDLDTLLQHVDEADAGDLRFKVG
jgi:hypothetical protein